MCLDEVTVYPQSIGPNNYVKASPHTEEHDSATSVLLQALDLFRPLAWTYGIPSWLDHDPDSHDTPYHDQLVGAGQRALIAQGFRN